MSEDILLGLENIACPQIGQDLDRHGNIFRKQPDAGCAFPEAIVEAFQACRHAQADCFFALLCVVGVEAGHASSSIHLAHSGERIFQRTSLLRFAPNAGVGQSEQQRPVPELRRKFSELRPQILT